MKKLLLLPLLVLSAVAEPVTIYNNYTNSITASDGATSRMVPSMGTGTANLTGSVTVTDVFGTLGTVSIPTGQNTSLVVAPDGSVVGEATPVTTYAMWQVFSAGMGVGLMFYGFGWQMRIIRGLGRHSDI